MYKSMEEVFVEAVAAAVQGKACLPAKQMTKEEWSGLFLLAGEQKLLPLAAEALHTCPDFCQYPDFANQIKAAAGRQAVIQIQRGAAFGKLYSALRAQGLTPIPVKGIICRTLYPKGELRLSGDEDLLVPPGQFRDCCEALLKLGYISHTQLSDGELPFEITFTSPDRFLSVELHSSLFDPDSALMQPVLSQLDGCFGRLKTYDTEIGPVDSLNPHDHMLYLYAHAFKHFVSGGFGLRQLCDIGMWAQYYADEIDRPLLFQQLSPVRADHFAAVAITAAQQKLGLALRIKPVPGVTEEDVEELMKDLLVGGIYGNVNENYQHAAGITLRAAEQGKRSGSLRRALFPGKNRLLSSYPVLKRYPALLPVVWALRIGRYGVKTAKSPCVNNPGESVRIAGERAELLRRFHIID